ncbi:MAG: HNH endonuclease signature motif containing protein [Methanothrix sp.]
MFAKDILLRSRAGDEILPCQHIDPERGAYLSVNQSRGRIIRLLKIDKRLLVVVMAILPVRESIPDPIKRMVRQEAGFGCCKCGGPIYEYHHIVPRSKNPEDIMILCPICHQEATVGAMLEKEQRSLRANPFNIEKGYVEGMLKVNQKVLVIDLGDVQFIGKGNFLTVDGQDLFSLTKSPSGRIELSAEIYSRDGKKLAVIDHNEWISGDPFPWDIESSFQWIILREKKHKISIGINTQECPIKIRADLWCHGINIVISQTDGILIDKYGMHNSIAHLCLVALRLIVSTSKEKFEIQPDPSFGEGRMISEADARIRIRNGIKEWKKLNDEDDEAES